MHKLQTCKCQEGIHILEQRKHAHWKSWIMVMMMHVILVVLKGYWTFKSKGIVKLEATIEWKTLKKLEVKGWFKKN
jgi:hypothetical protein